MCRGALLGVTSGRATDARELEVTAAYAADEQVSGGIPQSGALRVFLEF